MRNETDLVYFMFTIIFFLWRNITWKLWIQEIASDTQLKNGLGVCVCVRNCEGNRKTSRKELINALTCRIIIARNQDKLSEIQAISLQCLGRLNVFKLFQTGKKLDHFQSIGRAFLTDQWFWRGEKYFTAVIYLMLANKALFFYHEVRLCTHFQKWKAPQKIIVFTGNSFFMLKWEVENWKTSGLISVLNKGLIFRILLRVKDKEKQSSMKEPKNKTIIYKKKTKYFFSKQGFYFQVS